MRRILSILIWSALGLTFAWAVAHLPGRVTTLIGPYVVETSVPIAVTAVLLAFLVLYAIFRLAAWTLRIPRMGSLWRYGRRRRAGDQAVTRALVALAAGEKTDARREVARARSFLGDTPQTLLLAAEAGRLAGREDEVMASLRALAVRKDAAFLGLRGLLTNAIARQDWIEAAAIARQAEAAHPGAAWLRQERAQLAIRGGDWAGALSLAGSDGPRAALAVGAALAGQLRAKGKEKQAQTVLAEGWKRAPHPDLATFALALLTDKKARAQAAKELTAGQGEHPETRLLLARTALDAGSPAEARRFVEAARASGLNQRRLWLLLAEIEEEEHGETEAGRIAQRDALRQAMNADPDPEWRCVSCHTPQPSWRPACPACLAPGTLAWAVESWPATTRPEAEVVSQAG